MKFPAWLLCGVLGSCLVIASFMAQGNIGLNLSDEGSLWYGAEQTTRGEIPMRDYRSYEPGRYYWTAGWAFLFGTGIMGIRRSVAILQALGLTCGLLTLRRMIRSWPMIGVAGVLLLVWMFPRHKIFEHTLTMTAVYVACRLLETPTARTHFLSGVYVGVAAFFGRNHGLYSGIAFLGLVILVWQWSGRNQRLFRRLWVWGCGILLGYSPMIYLNLCVHDFFQFFRYLLRLRVMYVNLLLPVPWPWTLDLSTLKGMSAFNAVSLGLFFLMTPLFYLIAGLYILTLKGDSIKPTASLIASICIGLPYLHHAFARADIAHLAQVIHPFLIGLLCLPYLPIQPIKKRMLGGFTVLILLIAGILGVQTSPFYRYITNITSFQSIEIRGEHLWVERDTAQFIQKVSGTLQEYKIAADEPVFIAPLWPGLYPILQKHSPMWDTYFLYPATESMQKYMLKQLIENQVKLAIVSDISVDGREDLRFVHTHPLLWEYLLQYFEPVPTRELPNKTQLFKHKEN